MAPAPAIELRAVSRRYQQSWVVREVSLAIAEGETFVFIGPSGCGKSTTLKMMNRLVEPTGGEVLVAGRDVRGVDEARLRLGMGYVIQDVGLFAHYSVRRNVGVVPQLLGWPAPRIRQRTDELLELVGLAPETFGDRFPRQLSGGQRQRVGIARALAADPPIVLLDEPFGALDPITREHLQDEFLALSRKLGKTFVLVTHDIFEAVRLGDRIGVMREGRLVQCGPPAEIVRRPADDFVQALLGRHRYQLRLMTVAVGQALERAREPAGPDAAARAVDVAVDGSIWDALVALEAQGALFARVPAPAAGGARYLYLARADLVAAGGPEEEGPWSSETRSSPRPSPSTSS